MVARDHSPRCVRLRHSDRRDCGRTTAAHSYHRISSQVRRWAAQTARLGTGSAWLPVCVLNACDDVFSTRHSSYTTTMAVQRALDLQFDLGVYARDDGKDAVTTLLRCMHISDTSQSRRRNNRDGFCSLGRAPSPHATAIRRILCNDKHSLLMALTSSLSSPKVRLRWSSNDIANARANEKRGS